MPQRYTLPKAPLDLNEIRSLPKVELHVHLEGAIPASTFLDLARRNDVPLPVTTEAEVKDWMVFRDFPHFAEVYATVARVIRTPNNIEELAYAFLKGQAAQNVLHTEATYTAFTQWRNWGIPFDEQIDALTRARDRAAQDFGVSFLAIVDIPREMVTPDEAMMIARWVADARRPTSGGVVAALGLAGYEVGFPPEMFIAPFALAHEAGVPAVVHAGETGGAESVRGALQTLNPTRIGHGVQAITDRSLIAELCERQVPLEVCPSSNVRLGVFSSMTEHPFKRLDDAGVYVTLNTDDPPYFDTTMNDEYVAVANTFGYSLDDLQRFARKSADASLLTGSAKEQLLQRIG
jgi:adenosine deaminase